MRMRLGLLRDTSQIEKQAAKEAREAAAKKHKAQAPTVKTEEQVKAEEEEVTKLAKEISKTRSKPRIRPLSEAKAIESGANFISEAFLFTVAGGLIVFESWRSKRKETNRREDVANKIGELEEAERLARRALVDLEREVLRLRALNGSASAHSPKHIIPPEVWKQEEKEEQEDEEKTQGWIQRAAALFRQGKADTEHSTKAESDAKPLLADAPNQKAREANRPVSASAPTEGK